MAYYNYGFPQYYPSAAPTGVNPTVQPSSQPQQYGDSIKWVLGEQAAKSYFVPAGQSALLMDSETPVFYIKTVDQSGMPLPLRIFDYTERGKESEEPQRAPTDEYISRSEFESFKDDVLNSLKNNKKWDSNIKKMSNPKEGQ